MPKVISSSHLVLLLAVFPGAVFRRDTPLRIMWRRRHDANFVSSGSQPAGHLPRIFPNPHRFREKIHAMNQDAHDLYLGRDRQQAITPSAPVSKPQRRKENKPRKHHEKCGQKRVPQLSIFLARPCKQEGDERLCHPERRSDLADLDLRVACLCEQLPQSARRKVKSMKWHVPVDPGAAEHRPQPALTVRATDSDL